MPIGNKIQKQNRASRISKKYLFSPLEEWRIAESYIFQITMRIAGAYRTSTNIISLDENEEKNFDKLNHLLDKKTYFKIRRWSFKKRIDFLRERGILGDASHLFLNEARKVRNKIHDEFTEFSEKDLAMLDVASVLTSQFFLATLPNTPDSLAASCKSNAEIFAKGMNDKFGLTVKAKT